LDLQLPHQLSQLPLACSELQQLQQKHQLITVALVLPPIHLQQVQQGLKEKQKEQIQQFDRIHQER
jgi:hypothetical protein